MKNVAFHFSPKIHHAFGLLLVETMSPGTIKNRPIWSHCGEVKNYLKLLNLILTGINGENDTLQFLNWTTNFEPTIFLEIILLQHQALFALGNLTSFNF